MPSPTPTFALARFALGALWRWGFLLLSGLPVHGQRQLRPPGPWRECLYEEKAAAGYRFQGISLAEDGQDPLRDLSRFPREGQGRQPCLFQVYRIQRLKPKGAVTVREVWNDELPVGPGLECDWASGRCGGLSLLAFNPRREEAYLTLVVDAARVVTREVFAVSVRTRAIRRLGEFSTAGDTVTEVRISPSGRYVSFLGLKGNEVIQGLTLVDTDSGVVSSLPSDEEVKASPGGALTVTGYRWKAGDGLFYDLGAIEPRPVPWARARRSGGES